MPNNYANTNVVQDIDEPPPEPKRSARQQVILEDNGESDEDITAWPQIKNWAKKIPPNANQLVRAQNKVAHAA